MPDPVYVQHGQIVTDDAIASPVDPSHPFILLRLASDGSRRVIDYEPEQGGEPHPREIYYSSSPITDLMRGTLAVNREDPWSGIDDRSVINGVYIPPFPGADEPWSPSVTPVNQIPYVLRWRQHVGQIVHDFYTTYAADAFILENNLTGLSPADVSLTSEQEYSFEIITNQIRKLVGITWGRIDGYAAIRPEGSDTWKAQTPGLDALVHKLCQTCRGEGWKIDLIVDRESGRWGNYGADRARVYYPTRNVEGRWEAGDRLAHTTEERRRSPASLAFRPSLSS